MFFLTKRGGLLLGVLALVLIVSIVISMSFNNNTVYPKGKEKGDLKKRTGVLEYITSPVPFDDLKIISLDGESVGFHQFLGKITIVNLWATWCAPCVAELPGLDRLAMRLDPDRFHVVAISLDRDKPADALKAFIDKIAVGQYLDVYHDINRQVILKFKIESFPTTYIFDEHGYAVARYTGPLEWDSDHIFNELNNL